MKPNQFLPAMICLFLAPGCSAAVLAQDAPTTSVTFQVDGMKKTVSGAT